MSYLRAYTYNYSVKAWGVTTATVEPTATDLAVEDLSIELAQGDYLAMLTPGSDDHSTRCAICEAEGACRTWVEDTAKDANVPAQWLAEQVIIGKVNRYTSISEIIWQYLPF